MWGFCFIALLWGLSQQSQLFDMLLTADQLFEDFHSADNLTLNANDIKLLIKRTYELTDHKHKVAKRSADDFLFQDNKGVHFLSNITDVIKIPAKFPNDINILSWKNWLFIASLEANGTNPESQLANDMVVYQYSHLHGIKEIGRVPTSGGVKTAVHAFQNNIYLITAEHDANSANDTFEGSTLYKLVEHHGKLALEKIQVLNVIEPNDVQFWDHQDEFYLAIGSSMGNDILRTGTLIYRWMGHHFNCIQHIPSKYVMSVMPFTIGSFMYLAIANYQDEYGNTDIYSEIYQFHLEDLQFHLFQKIKTHGAQHITYFKFEDEGSMKSEHFLAVANYIGKNANGALTSFLESIVYKFNGNFFVPFQSFKLLGATKWIPVQGHKGEFLLLVTHSHGLRGYQYDGWRFSQVSLKYNQSPVGGNIQSLRAFRSSGEIFLTIADKSSYGESVNLWKLSFTNKNKVEEQYDNLAAWCESTKSKMARDNFTEVTAQLKIAINKTPEYAKLTSENLKIESSQDEIRNEFIKLFKETEKLNQMLNDFEENVEKHRSDKEILIVIGSKKISHLEIMCDTPNCVTFKDLEVYNVNGENFKNFLENVVSVGDDFISSDVVFENVIIEEGVYSSAINDHPSETLVDTSSEIFLNSGLVVNGTVFINNDLNIGGLFNGVVPDKNHLLLYEGDQRIDGKLIVNTLKVNNLNISGFLNEHLIEDLVNQPEIELQNNYQELNVNNMVVDGLVNEYNITKLFKDSEKLEIQGDVEITDLEAGEVIIYSNDTTNTTLPQLLLSYPCLLQPSLNASTEGNEKGRKSKSNKYPFEEHQKFSEEIENDYIIVVEGLLKANDISDKTNSASLLEIMNTSYLLNESAIDCFLEFENLEVNNLKTDMINDIPVNSWVVKDSNQTQKIRGKKTITDNVYVQEKVIAGSVNSVDLEKLAGNVVGLKDYQELSNNWNFDTITCHELRVNFTNFGPQFFNQLDYLAIEESATADVLEVDNLTVTGKINDVSWENILEDSIFEVGGSVTGEKTLKNNLKVENLNLTGRINGLLFDELAELATNHENTIVLDKDTALENSLNVEELIFEGTIDSILNPNFNEEWIIQNESQTIHVPFTFENVELKSGANLKNESVNNINLRKLFLRSIKIDQDVKIKNLYVLDVVKAKEIEVGDTVNGAHFSSSVVRYDSKKRQKMTGEWLFQKDLNINGSLVVEGYVSGLNLSELCRINPSGKINLIVGGSVRFKNEPSVRTVNDINISQETKRLWMKNENTTIKSENMRFNNSGFENKTTVFGYLNNINLTLLSKYYLSKTLDRVLSKDFEVDELTVQKWCRLRKTIVEGLVNGINLTHWANNVLLQDEEQIITGKLRFNTFNAADLKMNGTFNGLDLSKDVLRYDVEDAVVEGEKTFLGARVLNLTIAKGKTIQGVDVDAWRANLLSQNENAIFRGDLVLKNAGFYGPVKVLGKVNDIHFDSKHLFKKNGNQLVSGVKNFKHKINSSATITMKNLQISGLVNGLDLDALMKNQVYSDRDLVFTEPQTFAAGFNVSAMEVEGLFQGVNVSEMCDNVLNPVDVNEMRNDFYNLINKTKTLIDFVKGRAFFFDYFELIQTVKSNVKAIVPTIDNNRYYLAVFTPNLMRFMHWNEYSETFSNTDESLNLKDNITFVTSEITEGNSLLYMGNSTSAKMFTSNFLQEIEVKDTSCVAVFQLKALNKFCIFIGVKRNSSRILCSNAITTDLRTYQWLESKGSVQATALTIEDEVYLAVINKDEIVDRIENTLTVYRFDTKLQHFYVSHTLAEVNPVAVSSISYKGNHYLVSAGGHLPESVHNSVITIFRFNKNHKVFVRSKSIPVDTPVDVRFAILPSTELALYVLTSNPSKPFIVFLHKGIVGFVEETSGLSLYSGSSIHAFTDSENRHFVIISGCGRSQILKAEFKGDKPSK